MRHKGFSSKFVIICLLAAMIGVATAEPSWQDPSPHKAQFVQVQEGVRLEVLDWGGTGRPIVLLSGLGSTAHVFDDFAPKLARSAHVYGITRRGFGNSSAPGVGYSADRLGDDVLTVLAKLHLQRPVLAGHSIGGEELSSVASRYPEKVAGLVYLDAVMLYSFDDAHSGVTRSDFETLERQLPNIPPTAADLDSPKAVQQWQFRVSGVLVPASEFHNWTPTAQGPMQSILAGERSYTRLPVPILALCADPQDLGPPVERSQDPQVVAARKDWRSLKEKVINAFERGVPTAHVVRIAAPHFLFISNEREVLLEIHKFMSTLPP
jgi:pimeloyl-ACP methyl ester carboxylesterase